MEKILKYLIVFFRFAGILCTAYCLVNMRKFELPIYLLPAIYTIGLFLCRNNMKTMSPGVVFFNSLMFMRYVITPYAYYKEGVINTMAFAPYNASSALILMLYELIIIFITLEITGRNTIEHFRQKQSNYLLSELSLKRNLIFVIGAITIVLYIGAFYKTLDQGFNIFLSGAFDEFNDIDSLMDNDQGYINILWQMFTAFVYYFAVMYERNRYENDNSIIHLYKSLLYTFIFVIICFVGATGLTRWFTLVTATASLFCLLSLYPSHAKTTGLTIVVPLLFIMILSSLIKNGGFIDGNESVGDSANDAFGATNMDVYFNGLGNVSNSLRLSTSNIGFSTFIGDIVRNMPIVTHYIDPNNSTIIEFTKITGRSDQILPLIGQSYVYFGSIFSPFLSIISIVLFRNIDRKFLMDFSYSKYAHSFTAVWAASIAMCLNMTLFFMWFYIRIIPFYIILKYANKKSQQKWIKI